MGDANTSQSCCRIQYDNACEVPGAVSGGEDVIPLVLVVWCLSCVTAHSPPSLYDVHLGTQGMPLKASSPHLSLHRPAVGSLGLPGHPCHPGAPLPSPDTRAWCLKHPAEHPGSSQQPPSSLPAISCPAGQVFVNCSDLHADPSLSRERTCEQQLLNLSVPAHGPCLSGCACPQG